MASNRITEGVGKKIVEALKQQSDIEITPVNSDNNEVVFFLFLTKIKWSRF